MHKNVVVIVIVINYIFYKCNWVLHLLCNYISNF